MYDNLIKELREQSRYLVCTSKYVSEKRQELFKKAADTIEELSSKYDMALRDLVKCGMTPRWIPVAERLPEHWTSVIVHRKDGGIFMWEYFDTSPTDECWIDDSMNIYSFYDVTHWMPLPEPPKEET